MGRDIISNTPKFYLFDVGAAGRLCKRHLTELKGMAAGQALEHYIFMELIAYRSLKEKDFNLYFWRDRKGLEVDFILGEGEIAIEVKLSDAVKKSDLKGLSLFIEEHHPKHAIVVSLDPLPRKLDNGIEIWPWETFLKTLWADDFEFS